MAFKLGSRSGPLMDKGQIKGGMAFGKDESSVPGTPVIRKPLEEGVLGEANMDGSIYISDTIEPGSAEERQVINHEMRHSTDMKTGKLAYGDDFVKFNGVTYPRMTIDGKDMIIIDGVAKEAGDGNFPWEDDANNGSDPAI